VNRKTFPSQYLGNLCTVLQSLSLDDLERVLQRLEAAFIERRTVFIVGNGGSAATASHMANDLMLGVAKEGGQGFRVIALTDNVPVITAIANDHHYADIFSTQLRSLGQAGDVLIAISGSGNSPNVVEAVQVAREIGMTTIGFLGMGGGVLKTLMDAMVVVPSNDYGPIEDVHIVLDHLMTAYFKHWQAR
jgi:D-sedoheptulose 7-phosphate isomerase